MFVNDALELLVSRKLSNGLFSAQLSLTQDVKAIIWEISKKSQFLEDQ